MDFFGFILCGLKWVSSVCRFTYYIFGEFSVLSIQIIFELHALFPVFCNCSAINRRSLLIPQILEACCCHCSYLVCFLCVDHWLNYSDLKIQWFYLLSFPSYYWDHLTCSFVVVIVVLSSIIFAWYFFNNCYVFAEILYLFISFKRIHYWF